MWVQGDKVVAKKWEREPEKEDKIVLINAGTTVVPPKYNYIFKFKRKGKKNK